VALRQRLLPRHRCASEHEARHCRRGGSASPCAELLVIQNVAQPLGCCSRMLQCPQHAITSVRGGAAADGWCDCAAQQGLRYRFWRLCSALLRQPAYWHCQTDRGWGGGGAWRCDST
jgi:hypothetical protein